DQALFDENMALLDESNLNSVVLDVKDDYGNITMDLPSEDDTVNNNETDSIDGEGIMRSEEHTSELQSRFELVCRLLLEKKTEKVSSGIPLVRRIRWTGWSGGPDR